jgi:hypothetical protein
MPLRDSSQESRTIVVRNRFLEKLETFLVEYFSKKQAIPSQCHLERVLKFFPDSEPYLGKENEYGLLLMLFILT